MPRQRVLRLFHWSAYYIASALIRSEFPELPESPATHEARNNCLLFMRKSAFNREAAVAKMCALLNELHPIGPRVQGFMQRNTFDLTLAAGQILHHPGQQCNNVYFIHAGILRGYILNKNRKLTTWFNAEGEFSAPISSFTSQKPTIEGVEVLEDCLLLGLAQEDLEELFERFPSFNIAIRKLLMHYYGLSEERSWIVRMQSAEDKYQLFIQHYGHLYNRIAVKHIASLLGIAPETLSRLRNKARLSSALPVKSPHSLNTPSCKLNPSEIPE